MDTQQLMEAVANIEAIRLFTSTSKNEWIPVVAAIGGAFVGTVGSVVPNWLLERYKRRRDREAITSALICEISSMLEVIEIRRFVAKLREVESDLEEGCTDSFRVKVSDDHSPIYRSLTDKIGVVERHVASRIIRFHQLITSVIQDIAPGGRLADIGGEKADFTEVREILEAAVQLGRGLVKKERV